MKPSVILIYLLASCLFLGFLGLSWWQYQRGQIKQQMIDRSTERANDSVLTANDIDMESDLNLDLRKIYLANMEFYPAHIMLDNRTRKGKAGLEVIQPVRIATGWLLVNFGWLPWIRGSRLPVIDLDQSDQPIFGRLRLWPREGFTLGEQEYGSDFPEILQWLDYEALAEYFDNQLLPYVIYIDREHPQALVTDWQLIGSATPTKHYSYAIQWFFMALALLVLVAYYGKTLKKRS